MREFKIKMLKDVCATGRTFKRDEELIVLTDSTLSGANFNGAICLVSDYPHAKFFWHDEFEVLGESLDATKQDKPKHLFRDTTLA